MNPKPTNWRLTAQILALALAAVISFAAISKNVTKLPVFNTSVATLEDSKSKVMAISASSLALSFAITLLPDDYATPLADSLADLNKYFILILGVVFFEKLLLTVGVPAVFRFVIPVACILMLAYLATRRRLLKTIAIKVFALSAVLILIVPASTALSQAVCSDSLQYVNETIAEADKSADLLNDSDEDQLQNGSFFDKVSHLFDTAVSSIKDLIDYYKNLIKKFINAVVVLIVADCVIPVVTFAVFVWFINQLFQFSSFNRAAAITSKTTDNPTSNPTNPSNPTNNPTDTTREATHEQ